MYIRYDHWCDGMVLVKAVKEFIYDFSAYQNYSHMVKWYLNKVELIEDEPGEIISERDINEWVLVETDCYHRIPICVDVRDPKVVCCTDSIIEELLK